MRSYTYQADGEVHNRDVVGSGILVVDEDTGVVKVGDGQTRLRDLPEVNGGAKGNISLLARNGLVKNVIPTQTLQVDPRSKPWAPLQAVSVSNAYDAEGSSVECIPSTCLGGDRRFTVYMPSVVRLGAIEPDYPEVSPVLASDPFVFGEWVGDLLPLSEWSAGMTIPDTAAAVIGNGFLFSSGDTGDTGETEPDWSSVVDPGDTIVDGDITWIKNPNPVYEWEPNGEYRIGIPTSGPSYLNPVVLPTTFVGGYFDISSPIGHFWATGTVEPDWESVPEVGWADDGEILWVEDSGYSYSDTDRLVITGFSDDTIPTQVTVVELEIGDEENVPEVILKDSEQVNEHQGLSALSEVGFSSTTTLRSSSYATLINLEDKWRRILESS